MMGAALSSTTKDFFISYNRHDVLWATWIASVLEDAGLTTVIQAWDIRPGSNFIAEMQAAAESADRTIAVVSPNYLDSEYVTPEWAAAFADDPGGFRRLLVPVRVAECDVPGMLGQIVYIDLVGLAEEDARDQLLAGVRPGRAKPSGPSAFPGPAVSTSQPDNPSVVPHSIPELDWHVPEQPPAFTWRDAVPVRQAFGAAALEVHLVPELPLRLEVRRMKALENELVSAGRRGGLFGPAEEVQHSSDDRIVAAHVSDPRTGTMAGLLVTRDGQRGGWFPLPRDSMGSILDSANAAARIEAVVRLLMSLPIPHPDRYGVAVRIEPITLVDIGHAASIGSRNTARMPFASRVVDAVVPEDSVPASAIERSVPVFVEEIMARLEAALGRQGVS